MAKPIFCCKDPKEYVIVDDEDYKRLLDMGDWENMSASGKRYFRLKGGSQKPMHRVIGEWMYQVKYNQPIPDKCVVDHIDGRERYNVRSNLRFVTIKQNAQNQKGKGRGIFKGVQWKKVQKQWEVVVTVDNRREFYDYYDDPEEAATAYDFAAAYFFGEFAYLNYPERKTPPKIIQRVIDRIIALHVKRVSL